MEIIAIIPKIVNEIGFGVGVKGAGAQILVTK